jgi:DNA-directed RNA polymerase subunit K/omega
MKEPRESENRFEKVIVAGARARQLMRGAKPRVDVGSGKAITVARREVAEGHVKKVTEPAEE